MVLITDSMNWFMVYKIISGLLLTDMENDH